MRRILLTVALGLLLPLSVSAAGWKTVTVEQGVTVTEQEVSGRDLPTFRGVITIEATPLEILAVLSDVNRHTKWMRNCEEARLISRKDGVSIIYNRTDAPWPVTDRDVVLRSEINVVTPGKEIRTFFRATTSKHQAPVDDAVRMPKLEGHYFLKETSPGKTRVEYQVNADPGGRLPSWIAKKTTRELPLYTLTNLRTQVGAAGNRYASTIANFKAAGY